MKNILITRPQDQSQELSALFKANEFNPIIEPLFNVEKLAVQKISMQLAAIIITSVNAVFALENCAPSKDIKIFTVGKKTAEKLRQSGFRNVIISPENSSESLRNLIANETGNILYLRGSVISFDFAKIFKKVSEIIVYKTHEVENFSTEFLQFATQNFCDEVLIFSKNSAEIFFKLAKQHNLLEYFHSSQIVCLSEKIRKRIAELGFRKTEIFSENLILKKFYD